MFSCVWCLGWLRKGQQGSQCAVRVLPPVACRWRMPACAKRLVTGGSCYMQLAVRATVAIYDGPTDDDIRTYSADGIRLESDVGGGWRRWRVALAAAFALFLLCGYE